MQFVKFTLDSLDKNPLAKSVIMNRAGMPVYDKNAVAQALVRIFEGKK